MTRPCRRTFLANNDACRPYGSRRAGRQDDHRSVTTHLQEAAIMETVFAEEDRLHTRLHVVVDAAPAPTGPFEQREGPVMGIGPLHLLRSDELFGLVGGPPRLPPLSGVWVARRERELPWPPCLEGLARLLTGNADDFQGERLVLIGGHVCRPATGNRHPWSAPRRDCGPAERDCLTQGQPAPIRKTVYRCPSHHQSKELTYRWGGCGQTITVSWTARNSGKITQIKGERSGGCLQAGASLALKGRGRGAPMSELATSAGRDVGKRAS